MLLNYNSTSHRPKYIFSIRIAFVCLSNVRCNLFFHISLFAFRRAWLADFPPLFIVSTYVIYIFICFDLANNATNAIVISGTSITTSDIVLYFVFHHIFVFIVSLSLWYFCLYFCRSFFYSFYNTCVISAGSCSLSRFRCCLRLPRRGRRRKLITGTSGH